jgi:rhodanese-related sulfurtransferase
MTPIAHDELKRIMEQDQETLVIDVLSHERYLEKHIPGSISIPLDQPEFPRRVADQVTSRQQPVVVYCSGGACQASRNAARVLHEAGFTNVRAYEGGIADWELRGLPMATGAAAL